jgi:hypothetical protein
MYTKAAAWATGATSLPMWGVEGSGMVPCPNMVADFRDTAGVWKVQTQLDIQDISSAAFQQVESSKSRSILIMSFVKRSVGNGVDVFSACTFAVASQKLGK